MQQALKRNYWLIVYVYQVHLPAISRLNHPIVIIDLASEIVQLLSGTSQNFLHYKPVHYFKTRRSSQRSFIVISLVSYFCPQKLRNIEAYLLFFYAKRKAYLLLFETQSFQKFVGLCFCASREKDAYNQLSQGLIYWGIVGLIQSMDKMGFYGGVLRIDRVLRRCMKVKVIQHIFLFCRAQSGNQYVSCTILRKLSLVFYWTLAQYYQVVPVENKFGVRYWSIIVKSDVYRPSSFNNFISLDRYRRLLFSLQKFRLKITMRHTPMSQSVPWCSQVHSSEAYTNYVINDGKRNICAEQQEQEDNCEFCWHYIEQLSYAYILQISG
eukprot:TRINITY_DN1661_c0_g1_i3.p1 TRINITY_DN1661_c0_g1~~TRINITY_DN1661_c0_g1_i3.p1  ORF type:complete len:324 (-),score=-42.83 TRINITY_DN1661_c0_g1_i3:99-1070(-)